MIQKTQFKKIFTIILILLLTLTPITLAEERPANSKKTEIQTGDKIFDIKFSVSKEEGKPLAPSSSVMSFPTAGTGGGQSYKYYLASAFGSKTIPSGNYQTNLFTGSAGYSYSIEVPLGVNGLEPIIIIGYNHHSVNSLTSLLGSGWSLNENFIYRDINYTRSDTSDDYFRINFNGINEKLIYVPSEDRYHTKHESYLYIEKKTGAPNTKGEYWLIKTKDGTQYRFGYNPDSELVSNLENYASVCGLDQIEDRHNNKIEYHYLENPNSDIGTTYLDYISYNNGMNKIEFIYDYGIMPQRTFYSSGNKIKQSGILKEVRVKHNNSLVRKYVFEYSNLDSVSKIFLTSIRQFGSDGISELPPVAFEYTLPEKGWQENSSWQIPSGAYFVEDDWKDAGVRLIDIDFDGLTDILKMYDSDNIEVWRNNGNGWDQEAVWSNFLPGGFVGSNGVDNGIRFADINGDLRSDIIKAKGGERISKINNVGKQDFNWHSTNKNIPIGADFVTDSGNIIDWIDCNPASCPSGYNDLGVSCSGEYCTRTCSNEQCGGSWSKVWDSSYERTVYNSWRCSEWTDGFKFCGYKCRWGNLDCNQPQPYCYMTRHIGCGKKASSDVKSQSYYLYGHHFTMTVGCTDNEYDGSSWRCDREGYSYCLPENFDCSGMDNCRTNCWEDNFAGGMEVTDFTLKAWDAPCGGDADDEKASRQDCAAAIEVYVSPVTGNRLTYQCQREPVYELPSDQGVRIVDINGDQKSDILKATNQETIVWINLEDSWVIDNDWSIPHEAYFVDEDGKDKGVRIADINGDGLLDLIKADSSTRKVWMNNGKGWEESSYWNIPTEIKFTDDDSDEGCRIEDINGDGLNDIIKNKESSVSTWLNNGNGWHLDTSWSIPVEADLTDSAVRLADVNGDGIFDLIKGDSTERKTWVNKVSKPYLLTKIKGSLGGRLIIDYKRIALLDNTGNDSISDLGFNGWVVSSVDRTNSISGEHSVQSSYSLDYSGGFYDAEDREFRGFNYVEETRPDGSKIKHWFHQDDAKKGLEYELKIFDSREDIYLEIKNKWEDGGKSDLYLNGVNDGTLADSSQIYKFDSLITPSMDYTLQTKIYVCPGMGNYDKVYVSADRSQWYELGTKYRSYCNDWIANWSNVPYSYQYVRLYSTIRELYGNAWTTHAKLLYKNDDYHITKLDSTTEYLYEGQTSNPKITQTDFEYDNYGNIIKTSYLGDKSISGDEKYISTTYLYNADKWMVDRPKNTYLSGSSKIREIFYSYDNQNYGEAPIKGLLTKEEYWLNSGNNPIIYYSYDGYGNLISEKDPNGHTTQYGYDSTHTFPIKVINTKNQEMNYEYDLGTGNLLSVTDPNRYKTEYKYDSFGRKIKEILPYDFEDSPTVEYIYDFDGTAPERITIKQKENDKGTYDMYYYYDGFGNLVQSKKESEGDFIANDFYYDELLRIKQESNPYYSEEGYTDPDGSVEKTSYSYDVLGRIIQMTNPDNTQRNVNYNHWTVSVYDENNHRKDYIEDAYGSVLTVKEYNDGEIYTTVYGYNAVGDLLKITDNQGNEIKYTYDLLGRKTKLEDPDLGTWHYAYDPNSNLIRQTDEKGTNIYLDYDELNRIVSKTNPSLTINYVYDQETIGTLSSVNMPDLTVKYGYDQRLRKIKEEKIIDGIAFATSFSYDSMDRVTSKTLPDGNSISYAYNNQGMLENIGGILNNIDHNEFNQPVKREYANSLISEFSYYPENSRLKQIKIENKQRLGYTYDNVGNVVEISDPLNNKIEAFEYDDLDRLTKTIKINDEEKEYEINYVYDSICNMLKLLSNLYNMTFEYNPHAPISINIVGEDGCIGDGDCKDNEICQSGECVVVACKEDYDCGTDGFIGDNYCYNRDVYKDYRDYNCLNPGTSSSYCSHSDEKKVKYECDSGCLNGTCVDIECYSNSDCGKNRWRGDKYCKDGDIWQEYRKYKCYNKGTAASYCDYYDKDRLRRECAHGCSDGMCSSSAFVCSSNSDCGANGLIGGTYCSEGDVRQKSRQWTCHNPGTANAYCSYSDDEQLIESCEGDCVGSACVSAVCDIDSDCGTDSWIGNSYCSEDTVYQVYREWTCAVPGTDSCSYSDSPKLKETCDVRCLNGVCVDEEGFGESDYDLRVSHFLIQSEDPTAGNPVTLAFNLENSGNKGVEEVEWRLDTGSGSSISGFISGMKVGKGILIFKKVTYSNPGTYYPKITVDPNNKINEFDEENNQKSIILEIGG